MAATAPPPTVYRPGHPWRPQIHPPLPPGTHLRLTGGGGELALVRPRTPGALTDAFHSSPVAFGLVVLRGAFVLAVDFAADGALGGQAVFQAAAQTRTQGTPPPPRRGRPRMPVGIILVDGATGRIAAMRAVNLDPAMTIALRTSAHLQHYRPVPAGQGDAALRALAERCPDTRALIGQHAGWVCRAPGRRAPETPGGVPR